MVAFAANDAVGRTVRGAREEASCVAVEGAAFRAALARLPRRAPLVAARIEQRTGVGHG
jgi:hypothetical protein